MSVKQMLMICKILPKHEGRKKALIVAPLQKVQAPLKLTACSDALYKTSSNKPFSFYFIYLIGGLRHTQEHFTYSTAASNLLWEEIVYSLIRLAQAIKVGRNQANPGGKTSIIRKLLKLIRAEKRPSSSTGCWQIFPHKPHRRPAFGGSELYK